MTHRHAAALLSAAFACTAAAQDPIEAQISAAVAEVDAARIEATVRKLCSFGTRHVLSRTDSDTEGYQGADGFVASTCGPSEDGSVCAPGPGATSAATRRTDDATLPKNTARASLPNPPPGSP